MAMPRCRTLILAAGLLLPAPVAGQAPPAFLDGEVPASRVETAHLTATAEAVRPDDLLDTSVTLRVRIVPRAGMRVYAHDAVGYVPLTLDVDEDPAGRVVVAGRVDWPEVVPYVFPPTGEVSRVFDRAVTVRQVVTLGEDARRSRSTGRAVPVYATIRYQACDDRLCYRPATARIAWQIPPSPLR